MIVRCVLVVCFIVAVAADNSSVAQNPRQGSVRLFLKRHCFGCHGASQQKSGIRLDVLSADINATNIHGWQSVLRVLAESEMPPADEPAPKRDAKEAIILWLRNSLGVAEAEIRSRQPMRRLDRDEYRNTVRDLLELNVTLFDPTRDFPLEIGPVGREVVSLDSMTDRYLSAANSVIDRAIHSGSRPPKETKVFRGRFAIERSLCAELLERSDCETLLVGPNELQAERIPKQYEGTSAAGEFRIKIKATAVAPPEYFDEIKGIETGEPLRLAVEFFHRAPQRPALIMSYAANVPSTVTEVFELKQDGQAHNYEWKVWLEESMMARLYFANGPTQRPSEVWAMHNFPDQWRFPNPQVVDQTIWRNSMLKVVLDAYCGPMIHIHEFSIVGPTHEQWPPRSHTILMSTDRSAVAATKFEERLCQFAERSFRRPVTIGEIEPVLTLVRKKLSEGESSVDALKAGFKAILCSPEFLFFVESKDQLDNYAIATRLSYFLWSSMPDESLLRVAAEGRLTEPEVRKQQTIRMLADPKAAAFIQRFTDRWLNLDRPDIAPPDVHTFPLYYHLDVGHWSRLETQAFFRHILLEDLSITNFIDSEFVFANYELSKLYGLPGISGRTLRKVRLSDSPRGGLLGQASVLMATSTGPETSPILRGVWILNSLWGEPPSPPPPNVPPLEPDLRGSTSLRERMEKHRSDSACNVCHRKIDPLGFPLEAFDRIGKWRTTYAKHNQAIDTKGNLPDGSSFRDVTELKAVLIQHKDQLARCLTKKLVEYARGRPVVFSDESEIESIVEQSRRNGFRMQQLLHLVVQSDLFLVK